MGTREQELHAIMEDLATLDVLTSGPAPLDDEEMAEIRRGLARLKTRLRRLMQ
jgi:hypothetical protein